MAPSRTESGDVTGFPVDVSQGVKAVSDMQLKTLPKQFIQPPQERHDMSKVLHDESLPVIDMSKWDDPKVAESVRHAAETWGFFQIVNHGVPLSVLKDVKEATHRFFELPVEEKSKYLPQNCPTKTVRLSTSFSPEVEKSFEWKDNLSCNYISKEDAMAFWPPICRNQMLEYLRESKPVIERLLDMLMKHLNGSFEIDEKTCSKLMGSRTINLNYYPICPEPELAIGVGRHSDISTLTVLLQDETGGLYVRKMETENWVHVPPVNGSLTINVGDALQIMSNDRYKSIEHRVVANGSKNRVSVPIFVTPKITDVIGPLEKILEGGEKAIYKQVLYSDYQNHFFGKAHDGKATIDFAKV